MPAASLTCPGLELRPWRTADVDDLTGAVSRNVEHLRPWMPWVADEPLGRAARLALIEGWERAWADGGDAVYGAFRGGRVIGGCGLHRRRGPHGLEIGYWVDREHLGQGVGTSMARLLTAAAFDVPGVDFCEIRHDRANDASGRIPERLGYELVGEEPRPGRAPGEVGVDCTWRMTAGRWATTSSDLGADER